MRRREVNETLWTQDEFELFVQTIKDNPKIYYGFQLLYWCELRLGEMLALTPADFDFESGTVSITKSFNLIDGEEKITSTKTKNCNRKVVIPFSIREEMQNYINLQKHLKPNSRIFDVARRYYKQELERGSKEAGLKSMRLHSFRKSHRNINI